MILQFRHLWRRPRPTRVEPVSHRGVPNWFPYPRNEDVVEVDFLRVHWNSPLGPSRAGRAAETTMIPMVVVRVQGLPGLLFHFSFSVSTLPMPCTPSSSLMWLFWTLSHAFHYLCLSCPFLPTYVRHFPTIGLLCQH